MFKRKPAGSGTWSMFDREIADKERARLSAAFAFRKHVGTGRLHDFAGLSGKTGIKVRTLKSYASGQATPPYDAMVALMRVLPEDYANDLLHPAGLGGAARLDDDDHDVIHVAEACIGAGHEIVKAQAAGGINHLRITGIVAAAQRAVRLAGSFVRRHGGVQP